MSNNHDGMELVPQEADLVPGTPDALVDVESLDYLHRRIYDTQERVLIGYVEHGTLLKAVRWPVCTRIAVTSGGRKTLFVGTNAGHGLLSAAGSTQKPSISCIL